MFTKIRIELQLIRVNKYNSIWFQQKRNEIDPDCNYIRIHVNDPFWPFKRNPGIVGFMTNFCRVKRLVYVSFFTS